MSAAIPVDVAPMSGINPSGLSQAVLTDQINIALAKQAQDVAKAQGDAAVGLLEDAAELAGQLRAGEPGKGVHLDTIG